MNPDEPPRTARPSSLSPGEETGAKAPNDQVDRFDPPQSPLSKGGGTLHSIVKRKGLPVVITPADMDEQTVRRARELSRKLGLPVQLGSKAANQSPGRKPGRALSPPFKPRRTSQESEFLRHGAHSPHLLLTVTPTQLELRQAGKSRQQPITIDFEAGPTAFRRASAKGKRELLARAIGDRDRHRRVVDATAGLGRDAFLLAALGYQVLALERSAVLAEMLADAITAAAQSGDDALRAAVGRMQVLRADAADYLRSLPAADHPDVVYLDPMYETAHGAALAKKEMRVLRMLVGDDPDADELLSAARSAARRRVVVKRHRHAPPLADGVSHHILGTRVRYDVYMALG